MRHWSLVSEEERFVWDLINIFFDNIDMTALSLMVQ